MEELKGKVAFVTGGASGIGLGMARAFVKEGMNVVVTDIWQPYLDGALAGFKEDGTAGQVHTIQLDVSDRAAYSRAADEALDRFGKVHVLCNNAGLGAGGRLKETTFQDWDWALGVMLGGTVNGLVHFVPKMVAQGEGGHIINTSSMSGVLPPVMKAGATYTTGKAALIGLTEQARLDLADDNIGISVLIPGPVRSNIFKIGQTRPDRFKAEKTNEQREQRAARPVDPRWMDPDRVGEMVVRGIKTNALYIFTHNMFRDGMRERFDKMLASLPAEADDPSLVADLAIFTHNPIFALD